MRGIAATAARLRRPLEAAGGALLDVAFPPRCAACGSPTAVDGRHAADFCPACEAEFPRFAAPPCRRCATPSPAADDSSPPASCAACRDERWAFDAAVALGPYEGLLRHLVLTAKQARDGVAAEALGRRIALLGADALADAAVVIPIPMHWTRRARRGVNSAERLAAGLAGALGAPLAHPLRRSRRTPRQTEIAPSDRPANVRRAFRARPSRTLAGVTALLVDDVLTTGSTCSSAARELKRAGVARVVAVVAARRVGGF